MAFEQLMLDPQLSALVGDRDPFAFFATLEGEEYRALESRRTYAVQSGGKCYFVKYHRGTGSGEILKNLVQGRLPVVSAKNEWQALKKLDSLGLQVPTVAAYGKRGLIPQTCESFIVTEDVGTQLNLEDLTRDWKKSPPSFANKLSLLREVAGISRTMHAQGVCHRDLYLCHFMVTAETGQRLTLLDLHRALIKARLGKRWVVKDIGGLYFSSLDIGLTSRDLLRFVRIYANRPLAIELKENGAFWQAVKNRAFKLYGKHH